MKLVPIRADELERLKPLWTLLHAHHQAVAPELAPYVSAETSWKHRRVQYEQILAAGGVGFLAHEDGIDAGYALCAVERGWRPATFALATGVAELATLILRPACRGKGLGTRLFQAVSAEADAHGLHNRLVGIIPGNTQAMRFYASRGFRPAWLTLTRFARSPALGIAPGAVDVLTVKPGEIDRLRPLWLSLHRHHQRVGPGLGPFVSDTHSWEIMRTLFLRASEERLLMCIEQAGAPVAMVSVAVIHDDITLADTWVTGRAVGEIEVLVVAAPLRGRGIGSALLEHAAARLRAAGINDLLISAIYPNQAAVRLYERQGFRPAWLEMIGARQPAPAKGTAAVRTGRTQL